MFLTAVPRLSHRIASLDGLAPEAPEWAVWEPYTKEETG